MQPKETKTDHVSYALSGYNFNQANWSMGKGSILIDHPGGGAKFYSTCR